MTVQNGAVLVAGASGLVGGAIAEAFAATGGQPIWSTSRRAPAVPLANVGFVAADLLDAESCRALAGAVGPVTHLAYAAVNESPDDLVASWTSAAHVERNAAMLCNLLDALGPQLAHVTLVHGSKAYADTSVPDARFPTPVREREPRPSHANFYFAQEDEVAARRAGAGGRLNWTVLRAPLVAGGAPRNNLNGLFALGLYAVLRREAGLPLAYPRPAGADLTQNMVDVRILARAAVWASQAPAAWQQAFNVTNGDVYSWASLWPAVAAEIGLPLRPAHETISVADDVMGREPLWRSLATRHSLRLPEGLDWARSSLSLLDFAIGKTSPPLLLSTVKLRHAGFADCIDTEAGVLDWFRIWRDQGYLPPR